MAIPSRDSTDQRNTLFTIQLTFQQTDPKESILGSINEVPSHHS